MAKGGGESVCMHVLEALQRDHNLTVLTRGEPDFDELNQFFSTNVGDISHSTFDGVASLGFKLINSRLGSLKNSLLNRYIIKNDLYERYDLVFSTFNDLRLPVRSIQYIHHPNFSQTAFPDIGSKNPLVKPFYHIYNPICGRIATGKTNPASDNVYLFNSNWTANQMVHELDAESNVIYPPVHTEDFTLNSFKGREDGFVSIGRVTRDKRVLRNIEIIRGLRELGYDIHYHIIGSMENSSPLSYSSYSQKVKEAADKYEFIDIEGETSREEMVSMISKHKYGIHGKEYEHFGIAVAELVAGGTIPFVHRTGGQKEVVGNCDDVMYNTTDEAIKKMASVISSTEKQREVRNALPDIEAEFSEDRFKRQIRETVRELE